MAKKKTRKKKGKGRIRLTGERKLEAQKRLATIKEWGDRAYKKNGKRNLPKEQKEQARKWLKEIRKWGKEAEKKS